jgi:hypothetical protein
LNANINVVHFATSHEAPSVYRRQSYWQLTTVPKPIKHITHVGYGMQHRHGMFPPSP